MGRTTALVLACLALALGAFPLALGKPGLPMFLHEDEPAHYLAALSLARDGDLRCDRQDVERLFHEYPTGAERLRLLRRADGSRAFAVPLPYPLLLAPIAAAAGSNGMLAVNLLILVGMIALGARRLGRASEEAPAGLFAAGFVLLSPLLPYGFRLQGEVLAAALAFVALDLGLGVGLGVAASAPATSDATADLDVRPRQGRPGLVAALSGIALAVAAADRPLAWLLALPILAHLLRRTGLRTGAAWIAAAIAASAVLAGGSLALAGRAFPATGEVEVVRIDDPAKPWSPAPPPGAEAGSDAGGGATPDAPLPAALLPFRILLDLGYFLWGRHTGLLIYFPFAVLAVWLHLADDRRGSGGAPLLAALALGALVLVVSSPLEWAGGPEALGNRRFLVLYPAFLFLVGRVRPAWVPALGYAAAGLFLGPLLFTPFGAAVPEPDPQSHARMIPLRAFPVERTLVPRFDGWHHLRLDGVRLHARRDTVRVQGDELWVHGGLPAEIWLERSTPLEEAAFLVRNLRSGNRIRLRYPGKKEDLRYGEVPPEGETRRLSLGLEHCFSDFGLERPLCRIEVRARHGEWPAWRGSGREDYYLGAALVYLGPSASLAEDVFAAGWGVAGPPPAEVRAGERFEVPVRLTNRSAVAWPNRGAARVKLSYHWLDTAGAAIVRGGPRTELKGPLAPGASVAAAIAVEAPKRPGRYTWTPDLVREYVGWFSERGVDAPRFEVEVVAGETGVRLPSAGAP